MNIQLFALLTIALASTPPTWDFVAEQPGVPHLHVFHQGIDLGRCVTGATWYDLTTDTMHFTADTIKKDSFESANSRTTDEPG